MRVRKKLPIGIQSFPTLITEGYAYVDKTPLIARLAEQGRYYFLSRPRRFGKSLLVSTLKAAFSGQRDLFDGLYLARRWDWDKPHPVVHISFGRGQADSAALLTERIATQLRENAASYGIELENTNNADRLAELIRKLHDKHGAAVVVLVDEYDKPILDSIATARHAAALALRENLKDFYAAVKDSGEYIRFVLLTGVSKFNKVSLFSGLNNLQDISLDSRYAALCGYTEAELTEVFAEYLEGVDIEQLRLWYNGYNFNGEKVYNPYDVLLYLDRHIFKNYWFESGSPAFLVELLQRKNYPIPRLEALEAGEATLGSFDVDRILPEALLFQTGYLTIRETRQIGHDTIYELTYPNLEVRKSLTDYILDYFSGHSADKEANRLSLYRHLEAGRIAELKQVFQAFFASIPNDWYRKNQLARYEGYYASIVYCYFSALGLDTRAEEFTNQGRIDLSVRLGDKVFLIEFKVRAADQNARTALAQLKHKRYFEKYLGHAEHIYLIGIEFDSEARNITDFQWEEIPAHG